MNDAQGAAPNEFLEELGEGLRATEQVQAGHPAAESKEGFDLVRKVTPRRAGRGADVKCAFPEGQIAPLQLCPFRSRDEDTLRNSQHPARDFQDLRVSPWANSHHFWNSVASGNSALEVLGPASYIGWLRVLRTKEGDGKLGLPCGDGDERIAV